MTDVITGAPPAQNHPVAATFIKKAAKRGATLIVIDPRRQLLSRHAGIRCSFGREPTWRC
jgi:formate dehydrogenase major subunit